MRSTSTPLSTRCDWKSTTRSRTLITQFWMPFAIVYIPIDAKNMANAPSTTMTRKIDLTTDSVVLVPSDSALP